MATSASAITSQDSAAPPLTAGLDRARKGVVRNFFAFRLQGILFVALIVLSALPVLILNIWVERSAMEKEIASVSEKHLLIARNLSSALSRYVIDLKEGFKVAASHAETHANPDYIENMLRTMGFTRAYIIDNANRISGSLFSKRGIPDKPPYSAELIASLRNIARQADGEVVITDLIRVNDTPQFFVVRQIDSEHFALGALGLGYIRSVQRSIAFGERGHSMIVTAKGIVLAHPNAEWERISKNASKLSVVAKMMRGETGVARFYSPPMKADMIAGYTSVPETGWGVMVPQPINELVERAGDTQNIAIAITLIGILIASLIGWQLAKFLARPIVAVERAASAVAAGRLRTQVEPLSKYSPLELRSLAASFDHMVDELRHRDEGLRVAMDQAKTASRSKSEFLANMSHELRTPLNAILGFSEILKKQVYGPLGEERYLDYAGDIHNSGQHLLQVINDVLDVSKIEAGQLKPEISDVNLPDLVRTCLVMTENRARQDNISVVSDVPEDLPPLRADGRMTMQILLNLLSNALKFTPAGGTVTVAASREANGGLALRVSDTGIGIEPEDIDLVVQPFHQVDSSLQRKYEGTGLGLFLTKTMVELQGARQRITSRVGEGTTVVINFPNTATA
jgi:signal transduction histidine kinase